MPVELWGANNIGDFGLPDHLPGNLLLLGYIVITGYFLYRGRVQMRTLGGRGWRWLVGLSLAAFFASQFLAYPVGPRSSAGAAAYITLLTAVPILLAAAILPPTAAFWVGAAAGVGQMLGETHQFFAIFHYAFMAVFTAVLMQQNYMGQLYRWLREPMIAGALGGVLLAILAGVSVFAAGPATGLVALDIALVIAAASFWPRLLEGVIGGAIVLFILHTLPELKPSRPLVPSPTQRSLQKRLTINYLTFTAILLTLTLLVLYSVAITISTRLVVNNVAQFAEVISLADVPEADTSNSMDQDNGDGKYTYTKIARSKWSAETEGLTRLWLVQPEQSTAYRGWQDTPFARELIVVTPRESETQLVTAVPYTVVLEQAWGIGWPLLLMMALAAGLFYAHVLVISRDITTPLDEMVEASKTIAAGGNWSPASYAQRDDEIGHLQRAFAQMQRSMRKRLNELSLLLGVSHDVATSIDIYEGIPAILRGALRGTGAVGARAVVPNPGGGNPLTFGEGPASEQMASLDRLIMTRLRHASELMLVTPEEIRNALELDKTAELPVPALLAIPLRSHDRFQGILWLGFRQTHSFDLTERNLLSTLSTQGAVLVENARLYATAESGRRRLAAVLASTSDAVIVTDQTERVLLINPATERIFGFTVDAVRNRPVADVIPIASLVQALMGQDERPQNLEIALEDGKIYNAIASTIFSHEGQVFGRVAVLRDITDLKEIDKMKSDFVATVSHDLRSPLTFIRGYTSMLSLAGELTEKQHEYVGKILGGIDQMSKMVEDLLDIARIEGGMELEREVIELRPLLTDIATEYWQHAHMAGIQIKVEITADVSSVVGDLSLIRQAITNLVGNGIKYAPNSGPLFLTAQQANEEVIISVKDNGPGIAKEDQVHLFEKFYRVKARGTERVKGSGLGLAIVKTIATRHGGNAWVQSQLGKGSTFCISLPVYQSEPSASPEA